MPEQHPIHPGSVSPVAAAGGERLIIAINGGSSSIKFAGFTASPQPQRQFGGQVERLGHSDARVAAASIPGVTSEEQSIEVPSADQLAQRLISDLRLRIGGRPVAGIGHRVVHGGVHGLDHQRITPNLLAELRQTIPLDRAHAPREIALIEASTAAFPAIPQVACFDTAFHRDLPPVARLLPIPRHFLNAGVRRFGFHGLSYTYLMQRLAELDGPQAANGRVILAHLGSGASMVAVRAGKPVDTTMGFTPTSGLVMGTRPGDLDPGLLAHLIRAQRMSPDALEKFVSEQCGLLGISETSSDMRDLLGRRATDPRAAEAVDLFCYQAKKFVGALHAALGGLDTLVFSGGIGEHAPEARAGICEGLDCLGVQLDPVRNATGQPIISASTSRVVVRVIATDEELVIAQLCLRLTALGADAPKRADHPSIP